jgi:hypothetical protein
MNNVWQRVDQHEPLVRQRCIEIGKLQCDWEIRRLVNALNDQPKVEWKDSVKLVIAKS